MTYAAKSTELAETIPFPQRAVTNEIDDSEVVLNAGEAALAALEEVSRRIDVLAKELNCLGWFEDDEGPRAA